MKEKRRDSKGRILHTGESQRTDGKYLYKYVDAFGNTIISILPCGFALECIGRLG